MQKQAFGASRIHYWIKALRTIARRASLSDPEFVDAHLTSTEVSEEKLVEDFVQFGSRQRLPFEKPNLRRRKGAVVAYGGRTARVDFGLGGL